mmetsp:Transcript_53054/g.151258  ORF Transcript_53054/g.151258 Transcript_53054/m.151258 type:complete len:258 (-) Transcript_53054:161-934(-)
MGLDLNQFELHFPLHLLLLSRFLLKASQLGLLRGHQMLVHLLLLCLGGLHLVPRLLQPRLQALHHPEHEARLPGPVKLEFLAPAATLLEVPLQEPALAVHLADDADGLGNLVQGLAVHLHVLGVLGVLLVAPGLRLVDHVLRLLRRGRQLPQGVLQPLHGGGEFLVHGGGLLEVALGLVQGLRHGPGAVLAPLQELPHVCRLLRLLALDAGENVVERVDDSTDALHGLLRHGAVRALMREDALRPGGEGGPELRTCR